MSRIMYDNTVITICYHEYFAMVLVCDLQEGSRIQHEGKIRCQDIACFAFNKMLSKSIINTCI